jgi:RND family efflux transporter MFP subunit
MNWFKRILLLFLVFILIAGAVKIIMLRTQGLGSDNPPQGPVLAVHTALVKNGTLKDFALYRGIIQAEKDINLAPRVQGRIVGITGQAGDKVKKGQVIIKIDASEIKSNIKALQAEKREIKSRIWLLERTLNRQKSVSRQALSRQKLDDTQSNLKQARANLERVIHELKTARTRLGYTRLKAPFTGLIQERLQETGDMAQPGKPVLSLEDPSAGYTVLVNIPPSFLSKLEIGSKLVLKHKDKTEKAELTRLHPTTDKISSLAAVEAKVSAPPFGLPTGASIKVNLQLADLKGFIVPEQALLEQKEDSFVFVLQDKSHVQPVKAQIKGRSGDQVVLQANLHPGQKVIVGSYSLLMSLGPNVAVEAIQEQSE